MGNIGFLLFVIAYLLILTVMGIFISKKEIKNSDDFVVAGRNLPLIVLVGTLLATWVGGGTVTGAANFIYTYGPLTGILYFIGAPVGIIILYFMAGRVRKLTKYTIPEILEMRYGSLARTLAAIAIVLAYVGIVSYQFKGGGYVINLTTGLDLNVATLISAVFIIFFAVSGGMVTVAYSDFISALLIVGGMGLGIPFLLSKAGGWSSLFSQIPAEKMTWTGGMSTIQLLGYIFPLIFLILGDQNMYQRFASAKDEETASKSNIGFFIGEIVVIFLSVVFVSAAIVFYPSLEHADTAMLQVAMGSVPFAVGGIILAAAVAFMITTGDSYLLSAATNVTYDLWLKFFKPDASEQEKLKFTRITIVVLGALAYILGNFFPTILQMQMYSYTMYGAAITPAVLAAILWKRATKYGGLFSIIIGGLTTLIWEIPLARPWGLNSILIAAPLSILTLIIVSLLTPKPDPEVIEEIFS
ncbi:MAG: sodium:solute symporter family protein [Clostridia bacterium]|nr:sodium:solute symporter family protein [Clostridia bacterium]